MNLTTLLIVLGGARLLVDFRVKQAAEDFAEETDFGFFSPAFDAIAAVGIDTAAEELRDALDLSIVATVVLLVV